MVSVLPVGYCVFLNCQSVINTSTFGLVPNTQAPITERGQADNLDSSVIIYLFTCQSIALKKGPGPKMCALFYVWIWFRALAVNFV